MNFYMPVKVFQEENCVEKHSDHIVAFGKKALIVTGAKSAKANGSLDDVVAALKKEGRDFILFDRVEENPSVETVMLGRQLGLEYSVDFVIGIGGGSALDASKAIALMIKHRDYGFEYMYEKNADSSALPLVAIPTTCGTGSEVTGVSVLTDKKNKRKGSISHKVFPNLALIDAKYLLNAPIRIIQSTALDALTHLYESYANSSASPYSRMPVISGLQSWAKVLDLLREGRLPSKEEAHILLQASSFAGMAIAQTGTALPHALSYALTYNLGMAHGIAVGYFTAGYLSLCPKESRDFLLKASGFKDLDDFCNFYQTVCGSSIPQVDDLLLKEDVASVSSNKAKMATAPFALDESIVKQVASFYKSF